MKTENVILPLVAFAAGVVLSKRNTGAAVGSYDSIGAYYPNYHVIKVKYIGPGNSRGSRVKMISDRFHDSKTISYNYEFNNALDIAENWLENNGYKILGHGEGKDFDYVITDTFKGLKG
jgi:hypothetical protein